MRYEEFKKHVDVNFGILENQEPFKEKRFYKSKELQNIRATIRSAYEQINQYGKEKLDKKFIRLVSNTSETHFDNYAAGEEFALQEHCRYIEQNFNEVPDYIKFFQELFSDPRFFIKKRKKPYYTEDIMACIVDPRRVSDNLLQKLRLCDFSSIKNDPMARLEKKSDIKIINALKHIYMNVKKIDISNTTCLLLGRVYTSDKKLAETLSKYNKYVAGRIIQIQYNPKKQYLFNVEGRVEGAKIDKRKIVFFDNLEMYLKSIDHITKSVIDENTLVSDLNSKLMVARMYADIWKKDTPKSQKEFIKKQIILYCEYVIDKLKNSYNEKKVVARAFIESMRDVKNPLSMLLKLEAAMTRLKQRNRPTDKYHNYREFATFKTKNILFEIRRQFDIKRSYFLSLEKDIGKLLFTQGNEKSISFDLSKQFLDCHLFVDHYPYNLFADLINDKKEVLLQEMYGEDRNEFENAYIKQIKYIFFLEKYFYEEFKNLIVFEEEHIDYLKDQVGAIKNVFASNFPLRNKEILGEFAPSLEALNDYLDSILNTLDDVVENKKLKTFRVKDIINFKKVYGIFEKL